MSENSSGKVGGVARVYEHTSTRDGVGRCEVPYVNITKGYNLMRVEPKYQSHRH